MPLRTWDGIGGMEIVMRPKPNSDSDEAWDGIGGMEIVMRPKPNSDSDEGKTPADVNHNNDC